MEKLLAFTDIHFRASSIIGLDPVARFQEGLNHALDCHSDAKGIVIMGDLSHSGTVQEYDLLHECLKNVPLPMTLMLGNHDRREPFIEVFKNTTLDPNGFVQSSFELDQWHVITLDTLDGPPYERGHHSGRLCEKRLRWLETELQSVRHKPIALFMHHPLGNVGFPGMDGIKLLNSPDVVDLIKAHPKPVHVLAGHVHRTISGQWDGIPYTIFKSPCHQQPLDFATANSALAVDEPGAYGLILFAGDDLIVHTEDFTLAKLDTCPNADVEG